MLGNPVSPLLLISEVVLPYALGSTSVPGRDFGQRTLDEVDEDVDMRLDLLRLKLISYFLAKEQKMTERRFVS